MSDNVVKQKADHIHYCDVLYRAIHSLNTYSTFTLPLLLLNQFLVQTYMTDLNQYFHLSLCSFWMRYSELMPVGGANLQIHESACTK